MNRLLRFAHSPPRLANKVDEVIILAPVVTSKHSIRRSPELRRRNDFGRAFGAPLLLFHQPFERWPFSRPSSASRRSTRAAAMHDVSERTHQWLASTCSRPTNYGKLAGHMHMTSIFQNDAFVEQDSHRRNGLAHPFIVTALALLWTIGIARADELIRARRMYQQDRNVEGAIAIVQTYLASHPKSDTGYMDLGIYTRQLGVRRQDRTLLVQSVKYFEKAGTLTDDASAKVIIDGNIGTTYVELGDFARAMNSFNDAYKKSGRVFYKVRSAYCLARSGAADQAMRTVEALPESGILRSDGSGNEGLSAYNVALVYALARRPAECAKWLTFAIAQNRERFAAAARYDTDFDRVRSTPEFQKVLADNGP